MPRWLDNPQLAAYQLAFESGAIAEAATDIRPAARSSSCSARPRPGRTTRRRGSRRFDDERRDAFLGRIRTAVAVMRGTTFTAPTKSTAATSTAYGLCRIHTVERGERLVRAAGPRRALRAASSPPRSDSSRRPTSRPRSSRRALDTARSSSPGPAAAKTETMAARVVWLVANGARAPRRGARPDLHAQGGRRARAERIQKRSRGSPSSSGAGCCGALPELARSRPAGTSSASSRRSERRRGASRSAGSTRGAARPGALARRRWAQEPWPHDPDALLHRPTVATYNSFADQIVREHAVRIGRGCRGGGPVRNRAAWLLMRPRRLRLRRSSGSRSGRGPAQHRRRGAAHRAGRRRQPGRLRRPRRVPGAASARCCELPSARKGTTVYADVAEAADKVGALALLSDLAREYTAEKRRLGRHRLLRPGRRRARGRRRASRGRRGTARRAIASSCSTSTRTPRWCRPTCWHGCSADTGVMAVGDPHQAIYGWRGASAGNLGGFAAAFSPGSGVPRGTLA